MKKTIIAISVSLSLCACAGPAAVLVNADLDNALAKATEVNDTDAIACFTALKKANTTGIAGPFMTLEQIRILRDARGPCSTVLVP